MPPKSFNQEGILRSYALNDIVLARGNRMPFWPARVRKCAISTDANRGEWRMESEGGITYLWCDFIELSSCSWVSTDHIKAFSMTHAEYSQRRCRLPSTKRRLASAIEKTRVELGLAPILDEPPLLATLADRRADVESDVDMMPAHAANDDGDVDMEVEIDVQNKTVKEQEDRHGKSVPDALKDDGAASARMMAPPLEHNASAKIIPVRQTIPLPGELVLAKTGTYPFWPAIVTKCVSDKKKWNGKWVLASSRGDKPLRLWCAFVGDSTGGWVPVERIQQYTPTVARDLLSKPKSSLYEDHCKAVSLADEIHRTKRRLKVPPRRHASSSVTVTPAKNHAEPSAELQDSQCVSTATPDTPERSAANIDVSSSSVAEYSLGDIVLAKYDPSCPFWPAIIRQCQDAPAESDRDGKWRLPVEGSAPEHICCFFIADGSETWVSVDDIKRFTPARARYYLCGRTSTLYEVQRKAIAEATEMLKPRRDPKEVLAELLIWKEGDIVLAAFDHSPFWPARVQKCGDSADPHHGLWKKVGSDPMETEYYCSFLLYEAAKWTSVRNIKKFTAARARSYPCDKQSKLYKIQREAINLAIKIQNEGSAHYQQAPEIVPQIRATGSSKGLKDIREARSKPVKKH